MERGVEALKEMGIQDASSRIKSYPHEFSGGMRQRVMIAMALITKPELLIADEPTTALDVTVQAQILELIKKRQADLGMAVILVTHDLGIVSGFVDADGTCDPNFFTDLCNTLAREDADVVLGCRLNSQSKMPLIRRIGNMIFASILTLFSSKRVRDTASGMRVVRRDSLPKLMPLPDGLQFTPAMSARALLSGELKITEIQMPYEERTGRSKLSVGKDGLRFLKVILEGAFLYRPARPLALAGAVCLAAATGLMLMPAGYYLTHHAVTEWMIYRFVVSHLVGISAALLLCASYLTDRIVQIALSSESHQEQPTPMSGFFNSGWFWLAPLALSAIGVALVIPSFLELVRTGATYEHWSRFIAMSFFCSLAVILVVTRAIDYVLQLVAERLAYLHPATPERPTKQWGHPGEYRTL